ncbi:MAG TPA: NAD(P)H-hydrate epimerase, partial [Kofleriaceae bacterium]|nr:NAD(P)H-hydrate epimerase [Kofleriaceae bacterium]
MQPVATAAEMRALDAATIEQIGLPGAVLMETAGRAVAAAVRAALDGASGPVVVVAGAGNNGGDGHVCARVLRAAGVDATVYLVAPRGSVKGDAALHLAAYERSGGVLTEVVTADDRLELAAALDRARVVVDAVLGTGLDRLVEGHLAAVIERIDAAPGVKIAVDLPSGLSADTGQPLPIAVHAQRTVTLGLLKIGVASAPGFAWAGAVEVAEIGIPAGLVAAGGTRAALVDESDARGWLPAAAAGEHKGRRGHVLVVAGSPGKRGAGRLSATAALRATRPDLYTRLRLRFVGSSNRFDRDAPARALPEARALGVADVVREHPPRVPFLDGLSLQARATALVALGSTEPHYTASRLYPALLADRPLLALYHS